MHCVIMGCGRTGTTLARILLDRGHSVAIIDSNPDAFRRLGPDFPGLCITGIGYERQALVSAGIERADAFAAVSSGDNSNIVAARVARETYGVTNVVTRIYDAGRAEVYQRLGIPTVATVRWTAGQIIRRLLPAGSYSEYRDPSGTVVLAEIHADPTWVGQPITRVEQITGTRVAYLTRLGTGFIPDARSVVQEGDQIHIISTDDGRQRAERLLGAPPPREDS